MERNLCVLLHQRVAFFCDEVLQVRHRVLMRSQQLLRTIHTQYGYFLVVSIEPVASSLLGRELSLREQDLPRHIIRTPQVIPIGSELLRWIIGAFRSL